MNLINALRGRPLVMKTPLAVGEVERRINAATVSMIWPGAAGVCGWARFGRLRLWVREGGWGPSSEATLAGRIEDELVGSRLRLRSQPPLWTYYSIGAGYVAAVGLFISHMSSIHWGFTSVTRALGLVLLVAALFLPLRFARGGFELSELDLAEMTDFLEREVGAKPVSA